MLWIKKNKTENLINMASDDIVVSNNYESEYCWFDGSIFLNGNSASTFDSWRVVELPNPSQKKGSKSYLIIMKQYKHISIKFAEEEIEIEKQLANFKSDFNEGYNKAKKTFKDIKEKRKNFKEKWNSIFIFHTNRIINLTDEKNKKWINEWLPKNALIYVEENLKLLYSNIFMWRVSPHVLRNIRYENVRAALEENKSEEKEEVLTIETTEEEMAYKHTNTKEKKNGESQCLQNMNHPK